MESIRTIGDAVKYLESQGVPNDSRDTEDSVQEQQKSPLLRINKSIDRFFVLEDGILIKADCDFYKVYYTGKVIKKELDYFYSADVVAEKIIKYMWRQGFVCGA